MRIQFTCPACSTDYVCAGMSFGYEEIEVLTPDACQCGRKITQADREALARTATANRLEGLRDERRNEREAAKDAWENSLYDFSIGR